jgi:hypothetical protein
LKDEKRSPLAPLKKGGKESLEVPLFKGGSEFLLDSHGHLIVDHDLFNHDGLTENGIAEAFIEFAKKESLSFFDLSSSVTPFDAEKYDRLMDELEAVEIKFKQLNIDGESLRIDSEFYQKSYLTAARRLEEIGSKSIRDIKGKLDCSAFYPSITQYYRYESFDDIPFLRIDEIQSGLVQLTANTVFLPESVLNDNPSTICKAQEGDIIIAKGGNTLAKVGLVPDDFPVYTACRDVIVLKTNNLQQTNKYFLWAFLHSPYGQNLIWRTATQTGQPHINLNSIYDLQVPNVSTKFQDKFEFIHHLSNSLKNESKSLYQKAEDLLLSELGLNDWQTTDENI